MSGNSGADILSPSWDKAFSSGYNYRHDRCQVRIGVEAAALLLVAVIVISGCATLPERFETISDPSVSDIRETLRRIENERLLFLGEAHTSGSDHLFQLEVLKHLHLKGRRLAVAVEVFPRERQEVLNAWSRGLINEAAFERECDRIWDELYFYYGDIFRFCRAAGTPVFGIGAVRGFIASVGKRGTGIIPEGQLEAVRFSGCASDPEYEKLLKTIESMDVHEGGMPFFCDAQRLLDTMMARNISEILEDRELTVVVLAGAVHASNIAVPGILGRQSGVRHKVLLPGRFREMFQGEADRLADYFWY